MAMNPWNNFEADAAWGRADYRARQLGRFGGRAALYGGRAALYGAPALVGYASNRFYNWYNKPKRRPRSRASMASQRSTRFIPAGKGGRYKKRYGRKGGKRGQRKDYVAPSIKKYVKQLIKQNELNASTNTWRDVDSGQISVAENQCSYSSFPFLTQALIEDALDQMTTIQSASGVTTETSTNPVSGTNKGVEIDIINALSTFNFRNNSATPVNMECYWLFVKRRLDASNTPQAVFEEGLENLGIESAEVTDLRFNVHDSPDIRRYFKVFKKRKYMVNGGDEVTLTLSRKTPFKYDPTDFDNHDASFQDPRWTQWLFVRLVGVTAHDDTTTTLVGTCDATLDFIRRDHIKFSSNISAGYRHLLVGANSLDAMAAGSVVDIEQISQVGESL